MMSDLFLKLNDIFKIERYFNEIFEGKVLT